MYSTLHWADMTEANINTVVRQAQEHDVYICKQHKPYIHTPPGEEMLSVLTSFLTICY